MLRCQHTRVLTWENSNGYSQQHAQTGNFPQIFKAWCMHFGFLVSYDTDGQNVTVCRIYQITVPYTSSNTTHLSLHHSSESVELDENTKQHTQRKLSAVQHFLADLVWDKQITTAIRKFIYMRHYLVVENTGFRNMSRATEIFVTLTELFL